MFRPILVSAIVILAIGGLLGWLAASGPLAETFVQEKKAEAKAPDTAAAPVKGTIYDPDPQHLWNRMHRALWVRIGPDGKEYGHDRLDPLLWLETKYLVAGKSHEQALAVLDEFLAGQVGGRLPALGVYSGAGPEEGHAGTQSGFAAIPGGDAGGAGSADAPHC